MAVIECRGAVQSHATRGCRSRCNRGSWGGDLRARRSHAWRGSTVRAPVCRGVSLHHVEPRHGWLHAVPIEEQPRMAWLYDARAGVSWRFVASRRATPWVAARGAGLKRSHAWRGSTMLAPVCRGVSLHHVEPPLGWLRAVPIEEQPRMAWLYGARTGVSWRFVAPRRATPWVAARGAGRKAQPRMAWLYGARAGLSWPFVAPRRATPWVAARGAGCKAQPRMAWLYVAAGAGRWSRPACLSPESPEDPGPFP
ncbi:hypothetical protein M2421_000608 [Stenotrophomonas sp. BIGb0135]|nr:hypothetical protein [Stenotrophomonas sp. BIGb0135]